MTRLTATRPTPVVSPAVPPPPGQVPDARWWITTFFRAMSAATTPIPATTSATTYPTASLCSRTNSNSAMSAPPRLRLHSCPHYRGKDPRLGDGSPKCRLLQLFWGTVAHGEVAAHGALPEASPG